MPGNKEYCTLPSNKEDREKLRQIAKSQKRSPAQQLSIIIDEEHKKNFAITGHKNVI